MSTLRTTEGAALYQSLSLFRLLAVFNGTLRCHYISQSNWAFSLFVFPFLPLLSWTRMLFFWKGANKEKMKKKKQVCGASQRWGQDGVVTWLAPPPSYEAQCSTWKSWKRGLGALLYRTDSKQLSEVRHFFFCCFLSSMRLKKALLLYI